MPEARVGNEKVFGFVLPVGSSGVLVKQTIMAVMTALFLLVVFFVFVFPRFAELAAANKKMKELETKKNNLTKILDALDFFNQTVDDVAKESVYLAIPNRYDPGYILLSLRRLAAENGVGLVNYSMAAGELDNSPIKGVGRAIPHVVKLEISGLPLNMINFVDNLDVYLPIVSVSELSISEVSKAIVSTSSESKLSMSLSYYHMPLAIVTSQSMVGNLLSQKDYDEIGSLKTYKRLGVGTGGSVVTPTGSGKENLFGL